MNREEFLASITEQERKIIAFYEEVLKGSKNILEIGSGWGLFTRAAMMTAPDIRVTTIDKNNPLPKFDKNTAGFEKRIERIVGDSKVVLKKFEDKSFDTIFIDGDHGYEGFKNDFIEAKRLWTGTGCILIDDVLHKSNWKIYKEDVDFGIMKHLAELSLEAGTDLHINAVGHGVVVIK